MSAQAALPFARLHSLIFGPWCACRKLLAIRNYRPASNALLLQILALGRQLRLPPLPRCQCVQTCGACWLLGTLSSPVAHRAMLALPTEIRLPAGGAPVLVPVPSHAHPWCIPLAGYRLPASSLVIGCSFVTLRLDFFPFPFVLVPSSLAAPPWRFGWTCPLSLCP